MRTAATGPDPRSTHRWPARRTGVVQAEALQREVVPRRDRVAVHAAIFEVTGRAAIVVALGREPVRLLAPARSVIARPHLLVAPIALIAAALGELGMVGAAVVAIAAGFVGVAQAETDGVRDRLGGDVGEGRLDQRAEATVAGAAAILLGLASGAQKRLGLFSPGMAFGEVAMLDGARRSATVLAETDVECHLLKRDAFDALGETHPRIKIVLLTNMALGLARLLRKATREFSVFDH